MTRQLDMFAASATVADWMPAPPAPTPAPVPPPATGVHWLFVTTKRAKTVCGIDVPAFYKQLGCGYSAAGEKIWCTANRDDGTVTCPRCLEEMT
ncbi:hypothetical protein ACVWW6_005998 [Bradyrhizobium sp. USDA 3311]